MTRGSRRASLAVAFALAFTAEGSAAETFHRLKDAEIRAKLAGMEITDGVHWAEQYMADGTYKAFHMSKPTKGKWYARDGELCLEEVKGEPDCKQVWLSGSKVEFRLPGVAYANEGTLQKQQPRR